MPAALDGFSPHSITSESSTSESRAKAVSQVLAGLRVLVVRPRRWQDPFASGITALGGTVFQLPVMRIEPAADDDAAIEAAMQGFARYDKAIFLSRHAASLGVKRLSRHWPRMPVNLDYFAVGATTAELLRASGVEVIYPLEATSEGLLALPQLAGVTDQRVLILRGQGGRDLLRQGLVDRGARVDCCELYQRVIDHSRGGDIAALISKPDRLIIAVHSAELLDALVAVVADRGLAPLRSLPVLVPSQRVAGRAQALGFTRAIVAVSALPEHMVAACGRWYTEI